MYSVSIGYLAELNMLAFRQYVKGSGDSKELQRN